MISEVAKRKIYNQKRTPLQLDLDWRIPLTLDLWIKPSSLFVGGGAEEEEVDFNWHCKTGLAQNIQLVKEEFCKERGLKPFKVILNGPPISGKSFFSKKLAEHYNISHIYQQKLIEEIENWDKEKEAEVMKIRAVKAKKREAIDRAKTEE